MAAHEGCGDNVARVHRDEIACDDVALVVVRFGGTAAAPVEQLWRARGGIVQVIGDSGIVMGIAHRDAPLWGVQFHPESVLTEGGYRLLANWLEQVGYPDAVERSRTLRPHVAAGV